MEKSTEKRQPPSMALSLGTVRPVKVDSVAELGWIIRVKKLT